MFNDLHSLYSENRLLFTNMQFSIYNKSHNIVHYKNKNVNSLVGLGLNIPHQTQ
jgi:hypothetical protein